MIRGGLRTRFIADSLRLTVVAGVSALGWFDATIYDNPPGSRAHHPLRYITRPLDWSEPVAPNALSISTEDVGDNPRGLGGEVEDTLRLYVDILAEDDQVGWHLTQDVRDIVLGRYDSVGRVGPVVDVYDFRMPTPSPFTSVGVENALVDRGMSENHPWLNHWFMVRVDLVDEYYDEFGDAHVTTSWTADYGPSWQRIQEAGP